MAATITLRSRTVDVFCQKAGIDKECASEIEKGIYNWTIDFATENKVVKNWSNKQFVSVYTDKSRSVLANLDENSYLNNQRCKIRLMEKEFTPYELPFLKPETVFPDVWRECIDRKIKKEETVYEEKPVAMTNQFKCNKCKKRECIFQEIQLRSCDEPMTLFISCINCGHRWKI